MINKRILIKNLLTYSDESTFLDKKQQLNLHDSQGKSRFLKHIAALSNSNPYNNSFLIVGIEDQTNEIVGVDFYDDSKIQNLANAYLTNPPDIQYDNVFFPHLQQDKVLGLVTIKPQSKLTYFKKRICNILPETLYFRIGSNSTPVEHAIEVFSNQKIVETIEKNSVNGIEQTLKSVIRFKEKNKEKTENKFQVFKELFVICWSGNKKVIKDKTYLFKADVEFINEQIKLLYSDSDEVEIFYTSDTFVVTEYVSIPLTQRIKYYEFERISLEFKDNGKYQISTELLFNPPKIEIDILTKMFDTCLLLLEHLKNNSKIKATDYQNFCSHLMLCYLGGISQAKELLLESRIYLKKLANPQIYQSFKSVMRILRKLKYEMITKKCLMYIVFNFLSSF